MNDLGKNIIYKQEVTSTNDLAKEIAKNADSHGTIILAERQTKARGRLGRTWSSNNSDGIWMSIILKACAEPFVSQRITLLLAVTIWQSLNKATGVSCEIKWPNDLLLNGKKICGVLCESKILGSQSNYVIAGIGININQDFFEDDLKNKATSLKMHTGKNFQKDEIINDLIIRLNKNYRVMDEDAWKEILDFYKLKCSTLGKLLKIASLDNGKIYKAVDINENGNILVMDNESEIKQIFSDEVLEVEN